MSLKMKAVLDRIVDQQHAVLLIGEQEQEQVIAVEELPADAREGSWLRVTMMDEQIVSIELDHQQTELEKQQIQSKMDLLRKRKGSQYKLDN